VREKLLGRLRELRFLLVGAALNAAGYVLLVAFVLAAGLSLLGGLGLPVLARVLGLVRRFTDLERRRTGVGSPHPSGPVPAPAALRRVATWRELLWLLLPAQLSFALTAVAVAGGALEGVVMPALWPFLPEGMTYNTVPLPTWGSSFVAVPLGLVLCYLAYLAPGAFIGVERQLSRWLLGPTTSARLAARVERLAETRAEAVDASAVELRRIERDLHDGAQAQLVALALNLGMAEELLDRDPAAARAALTEARTGAQTALAELRGVVRGIHPPLLADRGLGGALLALAHANPIPVDLDVRLDRRLPPPVESAAYFTLVEALTNAARHSRAGRIALSVEDAAGVLLLRVRDDGQGGADPLRGSGLRGIERRLAAFDGTLRLSSPPGGPTVLEARLPCAS
jgi:signal transduction histidine kinase